MENASKALIMAGGVLIAMITISLFYFMFGRISTLVSETDEDTLETEIIAFNRGFDAYNKKLMYGTDIVSVLNKAIDNNTRYEATVNDNSEYYVNVIIILKEDLGTRIEKYIKTGTKYEQTSSKEKIVMKKNIPYSMKDPVTYSKIEDILIDIKGRSY